MFKKAFPFLLIFSVVILLYYPVLSTYFSHDDFFHFKVSLTNGSVGEFLSFFGFHPFSERLIAFYRPIFREVLYNTFYTLFGLNHLPFRIFSFLIHFTNIYLVFTLLQKLFKKRIISYLAAFFFAITSANTATFYYLAGGIQTQGVTMFILFTLLAYIKYLESKKIKFLVITLLTFLLAIASHEQSVILPVLLIGLTFTKYEFKKSLKMVLKLWPFYLISVIYLCLNYFVIGFSETETQYKMVFNIKTTLQTLSWYGVWALGIPETFQDFLLPGLGLNPSLMKYWGSYYKIIFPAFFTSLLVIIFFTANLLVTKRKIFVNKNLLFLIVWFPLGILSVLFLPQHKSTHYLYPSLPAFWGIISFLVYESYIDVKRKHLSFSKILIVTLLISLATLSATSAYLGRSTYWAAERGKTAEKLINEVKLRYPEIPKGSAIFFTNDPNYPFISEDWGGTSKQAYYSLNGEDALQLLYKDPSLRVFYEDLGGVNSKYPPEKIYEIQAHIK